MEQAIDRDGWVWYQSNLPVTRSQGRELLQNMQTHRKCMDHSCVLFNHSWPMQAPDTVTTTLPADEHRYVQAGPC
jgi:hypothetical protein